MRVLVFTTRIVFDNPENYTDHDLFMDFESRIRDAFLPNGGQVLGVEVTDQVGSFRIGRHVPLKGTEGTTRETYFEEYR